VYLRKLYTGACRKAEKTGATYRNAATKVVTLHGDTEEFKISVDFHQGSALSRLLFIIAIDTV
jgi:hypothetical protein